jgi:hypothetical protein
MVLHQKSCRQGDLNRHNNETAAPGILQFKVLRLFDALTVLLEPLPWSPTSQDTSSASLHSGGHGFVHLDWAWFRRLHERQVTAEIGVVVDRKDDCTPRSGQHGRRPAESQLSCSGRQGV